MKKCDYRDFTMRKKCPHYIVGICKYEKETCFLKEKHNGKKSETMS